MRFFKILILFFIFSTNVLAERSGTGSEDIPELTGEIYFYEENWWPIDISLWMVFWTPLNSWEYWESLFNTFINNNIEVSLYCTSEACDSNTSTWILMTENWIWSLTN